MCCCFRRNFKEVKKSIITEFKSDYKFYLEESIV